MSNYELILLRHGESEWNAKNLFTGWVDVRLSAKGEDEARRGGALLAERSLLPDLLHTSLLRRAIHTSQLALDACDRHWIPVKRSWRLNERHYGALQGKDKRRLWPNMAKNSSSCGAVLLMCHHLPLMTMMSFHRLKMHAIATSPPLRLSALKMLLSACFPIGMNQLFLI